MVHIGPRILITTSRRPSEHVRSLCKVLGHILPESLLYSRGANNEKQIHDVALRNNTNHIIFVHSKRDTMPVLIIKNVTKNKLIQEKYQLEFLQYIDPKILNWTRLPASGPLSTTLETRQQDPKLVDFLEKYLMIVFNKKNSLWLVMDINNNRRYIQFIDAITMRKFLFAEVRLITR